MFLSNGLFKFVYKCTGIMTESRIKFKRNWFKMTMEFDHLGSYPDGSHDLKGDGGIKFIKA